MRVPPPRRISDVIRKDAWSFYRTISGVRLCWELEGPKGPESVGADHDHWGVGQGARRRSPWSCWSRTPDSSLQATQGQIDGFFSQLPYRCHQDRVASLGDQLKICAWVASRGREGARGALDVCAGPAQLPHPRRALQPPRRRHCRGRSSSIRKRTSPGPYRRPMPRVLGGY